MDQAQGLRTLIPPAPGMNEDRASFGSYDNTVRPRRPRVISVSSGKGGVGKTNIVANFAWAFTRMGRRVLIFDADLSLANIDVLLGLAPKYTVEHLFKREKSIFEILVQGPGGMRIIPASSGVLDLIDLDETQKIFLLNELDLLAETIDVLLIDTGTGISSNVLYFNTAAAESIIIVTPEPTSITDAYALIKVLSQKYRKKDFLILINAVRSPAEGKDVFKKLTRVTDRFQADLSLDYLGFLPFDEKLPQAVKQQKPVLKLFPDCAVSRSLWEMACSLADRPAPGAEGTVGFFWRQLFQFHSSTSNGGID